MPFTNIFSFIGAFSTCSFCNLRRAGLVVVNAGAHSHRIGGFNIEAYRKRLEIVRDVMMQYPDTPFLFRGRCFPRLEVGSNPSLAFDIPRYILGYLSFFSLTLHFRNTSWPPWLRGISWGSSFWWRTGTITVESHWPDKNGRSPLVVNIWFCFFQISNSFSLFRTRHKFPTLNQVALETFGVSYSYLRSMFEYF